MGVASDLKLYCSANMPLDDSSASGGAIDALRRPNFSQIVLTGRVEAVSSAGGDTSQTLTITGRTAAGVVVSETKTLNGVNPIVFTTLGSVIAVLKAELSATTAGNITVRAEGAGATIGVIPIGERGFMAPHRQAASSLGSTETFYYKIFAKNTHASHTLNTAAVAEMADPQNRVAFALAASKGDSGSVANRKTSPGLTFNSTQKSVPTGALAAGETIGIWLQYTHPAGEATHYSSVTVRVLGGSFP